MKLSPSTDSNESFWSIGTILGVSMGLPGMLMGSRVLSQYSEKVAFIPIVLAYLILWILGLGITSMAQNKNHAIDNIKDYFGRFSATLAALIFTLAFLTWYAVQIDKASEMVTSLTPLKEKWQIGALLGVSVAFISLGGLKTIKWVCLVSAPILLGLAIFFRLYFPKAPVEAYPQDLSSWLGIIPIIVISWLPGTVNLPTFFRHCKSKYHSVLALSLILLLHLTFTSLMLSSDVFTELLQTPNHNSLLFLARNRFILFSVLTCVCVNLVNIYFLAEFLTLFFPSNIKKIYYLISGLSGSLLFLILNYISQAFLSMIFDHIICAISILLLALLINYLITIAVKHRLLYLSKLFGSVSWILGTTISSINLINNPELKNYAIVQGCLTTIIFSVCIVFIEETLWSIKTLKNKKEKQITDKKH